MLHGIIETLKEAGEFLLIYVGLRYLVVRRIGRWIDNKIDEHPIRWGRFLAIWNHYQLRAIGDGHQSDHVLECTEEKCQVLKTTLAQSAAQSTS